MTGSSAPAAEREKPNYGEWARTAVFRAWDPQEDGGRPDGWVVPLAQIGSGVVYALLDIARAIRES
jgi:hypothetical protein